MVASIWTDGSNQPRISGRLLRRMTLPIVAVGVLLLAAGVFGAWRVHRLHQRGSAILSENVVGIRAAEELEAIARELQYRLKRHLITDEDRYLHQAAQLQEQAADWFDKADDLAKTERERQLIHRMRLGQQRLESDLGRSVKLPPSVARAEMLRNLADEVLPNKLLIYIQKYIRLNEQEVTRSSQRNQATANQLMFGLILLGTCGGVAGMLAGYGIARRVSRTIVQLAFPIRDVAGKLSDAVGPVAIAADPGFNDLESVLQTVSQRVTTVVERLQQSEREALRAEQLAAVGQLAAGMAHELRNPLTSMKVIMQSADKPDDLDAEDLAVLKEETERLESTVQAFLDFARPPALQEKEISLMEVLDQTVALAAPRAKRCGINFEYHAPDPELLINADVGQIRQVALNLVLNAFEAVPRGGTVRLDVRCEAGDGDSSVTICVTDNGTGLPAELGDRIFDPFVSTKETGTGLGLAISRRIVEAHNGRICAADRIEGGAMFTVELQGNRPLTPARSTELGLRVES
jgi:two-component system, NtrC family, sensor histidine kinase HydH